MSFKVGSNKYKWRLNALLLSGGNSYMFVGSTDIESITNQSGFGLSAGNEYHKPINENFEFVFGYDFFYNYSMSIYDDGFSQFISQQKEHIVIGAELLPFASWDKGTLYNLNRFSNSRDARVVS